MTNNNDESFLGAGDTDIEEVSGIDADEEGISRPTDEEGISTDELSLRYPNLAAFGVVDTVMNATKDLVNKYATDPMWSVESKQLLLAGIKTKLGDDAQYGDILHSFSMDFARKKSGVPIDDANIFGKTILHLYDAALQPHLNETSDPTRALHELHHVVLFEYEGEYNELPVSFQSLYLYHLRRLVERFSPECYDTEPFFEKLMRSNESYAGALLPYLADKTRLKRTFAGSNAGKWDGTTRAEAKANLAILQECELSH